MHAFALVQGDLTSEKLWRPKLETKISKHFDDSMVVIGNFKAD